MEIIDSHGPTGQAGDFSYRDIYETVPVSIWVEDWSAVKRFTDTVKRRGVADLWAYFIDHPEPLRELASMVEVHDVNWTSVTLYRAPNKQALIETTWGATMSDNELSGFLDQVVAFASGKTAVMTEVRENRFDGKPIWIRHRAVIHPQHVEDWSLVIFAASDISQTMVIGKALGGDLERLSDILCNIPCALYRRVRKADGTVTYPYINGLGRLLPGFGRDIEDRVMISEAVVSGASNHADDSGRWSAAWRDSTEQLAAVDIEYRIVDPAGQAVWIRNSAIPKRGTAGEIIWDGVMIGVAGQIGG